MAPSLLIGFALASAVAALAHRFRALTAGGALWAAAIGTLVFVAGGLAWSALLLLFFLPSSVLSHLPGALHGAAEKSARRDAGQVLANGAVAAGCALLAVHRATPVIGAAFAGALAAAASDTWATELGTRFGGAPRLLSTGRHVAPGTSGGVTAIGLVASLVGAATIATAELLAISPSTGVPVLLGGLAGSLTDTGLGATLQHRRYCPVCKTATEQPVHATCGTPTRSAGGLAWLDNDAVNGAATLTGAVIAALCRSLV
jgi:uncharacterized protein (TIGR00297 family)